MSLITIETEKCIKCNQCLQSCPVSIISMDADKYPVISEEKEKSCIYCGHCESVCPENALIHKYTSESKEPLSNEMAEIDPLVLGKYFRGRRSIRNYQNKAVDRDILLEIMDVVRYAPTGTNRQFNQWIIVHDKEMVKKLADGTIQWMKKLTDTNPAMSMGYNFPGIISSYERGRDRICRDAPHLIIAYTFSAYTIGAKDATIAASHLELLLPSYGLGACWAGFLYMALQADPDLKKLIGLNEKHSIHAALMIGYPKFRYHKVPVRNKSQITWL